jgi:translocator protein
MTWIEWYDSLTKPSWTPAPSTISLIWMILYPIILVWCVVAVWPQCKWVAVVQVPYFVWVSIATVLQLSITAMNW